MVGKRLFFFPRFDSLSNFAAFQDHFSWAVKKVSYILIRLFVLSLKTKNPANCQSLLRTLFRTLRHQVKFIWISIHFYQVKYIHKIHILQSRAFCSFAPINSTFNCARTLSNLLMKTFLKGTKRFKPIYQPGFMPLLQQSPGSPAIRTDQKII